MACKDQKQSGFEFIKEANRATRTRPAQRANDLDGAKWLMNSISVWSDIRKTSEEMALGHPAMFPSMLVERLIATFTNHSQTRILDPFMGSGSTVVAASRLGKTGIGVELNPKYVALAKNRLAKKLLDSASAEEQYEIHSGDVRRLLEFVEPNSVDMTVTSPPYWDILNQARSADGKDVRNYGNLDGDLGAPCTYGAFIDSLQRVFELVHVVMKPGSYCVVVVMDLRKKSEFFPFHIDVAQMMDRVGFIYDDLIIWNRQSEYNNLRPLGYPSVFRVNKVHEFCLIFKTLPMREKKERDDEILRLRKLPGS